MLSEELGQNDIKIKREECGTIKWGDIMSEQRFIQSWNMHRGLHYLAIEDTVEKKMYCVEQEQCDVEKVCDVLNEQQATIQHLAVEKHQADKRYQTLLGEQQATIKQLQEENIELKKLRKYCANWIGVKEENLYEVVR